MTNEAGVSRRGWLLAAAAVVAGGGGLVELVDQGVLPGQHRLHALLGEDGPGGVIPDVATGAIETGSTRGVPWALCHPEHTTSAPRLVVALGGRDATIDDALQNIGLARFLAASGASVALLIVDGGSSYYHRRRDGTDVGALVLDRLVPMAAQRGIDTRRPAFYGWSMGGYGALLLATERRRRGLPVAAVAASSAALWSHAGDTAPGAFDDAADFDAHNVFTRAGDLRGVPVRIDCGLDDPFYESDRRFAALLGAEGHYGPGAHNDAFWSRVFPAQLAWLTRRLA